MLRQREKELRETKTITWAHSLGGLTTINIKTKNREYCVSEIQLKPSLLKQFCGTMLREVQKKEKIIIIRYNGAEKQPTQTEHKK